ncbi:adenylosuccinate synthetase [Candidatus Uhrbacteria bacterium]|nr:adenylosuccinate synthetase [Candidatus Uhrbacteria bacterium]
MKKAYIVTDLGPGDGGKGGVVHRLASLMHAHTIVKVGGAQGSHGVRTSRGQAFAFSQWGCGTLEGIHTHISPRFVVSPEGLLNEGQAIRYGTDVYDPFDLLTVDERALCATPYHGIASRLKELARCNNPRGTIGTGVGETYRYSQRIPELSIFARDLSRADLAERLAAVRDEVIGDLSPIMEGPFLDSDREAAGEEIANLRDDNFLEYVVRRFQEVARLAKIVDAQYLEREILAPDGIVVVESSHGILTDSFSGFHPHTSAIRTLPRFAEGMLRDAGYDGQVVHLGVHRAYTIRHGAGPMPTADPMMGERLLPGSHKENNRWQGEVRVGSLDLPLVRYALAASQGTYNGLAITWFDQLVQNGEWNICNRYKSGAEDPSYFTPQGELKIRQGEDKNQLSYLEALGAQVARCVPEVETIRVPQDQNPDQLFGLVAAVLNERLGVPVRMISLGPTEVDKHLK